MKIKNIIQSRKVPYSPQELKINYSILLKGMGALLDLNNVIAQIDKNFENIEVEELEKLHLLIAEFNEAGGMLGIGVALHEWLENKIKEKRG